MSSDVALPTASIAAEHGQRCPDLRSGGCPRRGLVLAAGSTAISSSRSSTSRDENRVLREMFGTRRLRFRDTQRHRLTISGKELGRRLPAGIDTLLTPDTIVGNRLVGMVRYRFATRRDCILSLAVRRVRPHDTRAGLPSSIDRTQPCPCGLTLSAWTFGASAAAQPSFVLFTDSCPSGPRAILCPGGWQ